MEQINTIYLAAKRLPVYKDPLLLLRPTFAESKGHIFEKKKKTCTEKQPVCMYTSYNYHIFLLVRKYIAVHARVVFVYRFHCILLWSHA